MNFALHRDPLLTQTLKPKNRETFKCWTLECVRYEISSEAAAALANALLKDFCVLSDRSADKVIDKSKIDFMLSLYC